MADADLVLKTKIKIFKAVIERDPQAPVFVELAESLIADGRPEEAVAICRRGLEYHPGLLAGRVALIEALLAGGNTEEAREAFSSARMEASLARRYLGRLGGLADDLSLAAEPDAPTPEPPLDELIQALAEEPTEAASGLSADLVAELLDEEQQSRPGSGPLTSATLAQLYLDQGYKDSAVQVIKRLLESDPANPALQKRLEQLAASVGPEAEYPEQLPAEAEIPEDKPTEAEAPGDKPVEVETPEDRPVEAETREDKPTQEPATPADIPAEEAEEKMAAEPAGPEPEATDRLAEKKAELERMELAGILTRWRDAIRTRLARGQA